MFPHSKIPICKAKQSRSASSLSALLIFACLSAIGIAPSWSAEVRKPEPLAHAESFGLERSPLPHKVLHVGPRRNLTRLSEAAALAHSGDTIAIDSGTYVGCAVWPKGVNYLVVESLGGMAVITGPSCDYKGLFVTKGDHTTIRGITFTGAQALHHNGAGIRAEGRDLTIEHSRFIDNEDGILAAPNIESTIIIRDSVFEGNGNCIEDCAHGIYVGNIAELRIEHSQFVAQMTGHHVKSRARRTELIGNTIEDGAAGTASYLVDIPNGGSLVMRGNTLQKGALSENPAVAVILGEEGATNVTSEIVIEDNVFKSDLPKETRFVSNRTEKPALLRRNRLTGLVYPLDGPGTVDNQTPPHSRIMVAP
jgi:hypothetical protein